jgi:hypothetical protein
VASRTLWYGILPGIAVGAIKKIMSGNANANEDNWDWAVDGIAGEVGGTIPIARSLVDFALNATYGVELTPLERQLTAPIEFLTKDVAPELGIGKADHPTDRFLQHMMDTAGYAFGIPVGGQVSQIAQ